MDFFDATGADKLKKLIIDLQSFPMTPHELGNEINTQKFPYNKEKIRIWEASIYATTKKISDAAEKLLPRDGVLIDIGANVGLFTVQVFAKNPCRAYLFEPVPEYYQYTADRFQNIPEVSVIHAALSDAPGKLTLWMDSENLGWNTLVGEKQEGNMKPIDVKAITFDDFARENKIDRIDVIKIDVEGGEFKVLAGMRETLASLDKKPYIFCEVAWGPKSHPHWDKEVAEFEWLFENGYQRFDYNINDTTDFIICPKPEFARVSIPNELQIESELEHKPLITIGVPTRNRLTPLLTLIDSIAKQTYQHFELLISDDGDKYNLEAEIRKTFPKLDFRVIKGPRVSLPKNRQNILDNARTELVLMCDDDHYMQQDCVQHLVQTIIKSNDTGIVSAIWPHPYENPKTVSFNEMRNQEDFRLDLKNINRNADFWWKNGCEMFKAFQKEPQVFESEFAGGGCLIYRKSAVINAGGFPDCYSVVSFREDTDMSHRVLLQGYKVLVNPAAMALHLSADSGGCKDSPEWAKNFVNDGLRFLERLESWRLRETQLELLKKQQGPVKVLMFYDEVGWAWWHRAHHIKKHIGSNTRIDIKQINEKFDHNDYDLIVVFDHYLLGSLSGTPVNKLVIGNSCPKLIDDSVKDLQIHGCLGGFVNNYETFKKVKNLGNYFCCQNGVDAELFYPAKDLPPAFTACWTGNSKSIGNKGLDLIQEACRIANVPLIIQDADTFSNGGEKRSQDWLRDNFYQRASVYICASEWEGTPNPALEALACGVPVISTTVGNMTELVVDGYNGFLVERTSQSIADALLKLQTLPKRLLQINARKTIELGWTWKDKVKNYELMFEELRRKRTFGDITVPEIEPEKVQALVDTRMQRFLPPPSLESLITKSEGKYHWITNSIYPDGTNQDAVDTFVKIFSKFESFYLHHGGVGDALLLLSTFYDRSPNQVIISVSTNPAIKSFFDCFPLVKKVYFLDFPAHPFAEQFLRLVCAKLPNCLGRGVAPEGAHAQEWLPGVDIFAKYNIKKQPTWTKSFESAKLSSPQICIAPCGSQKAMDPRKRNIINPEMWDAILSCIVQSGVKPIILGTPEEKLQYPALYDSLDLRSYDFASQMKLINGSDLLIAADSWAKTFAALSGIRTLVFKPLVAGELANTSDPSANVFLHPWETISVIESVSDLENSL